MRDVGGHELVESVDFVGSVLGSVFVRSVGVLIRHQSINFNTHQ